MGTRRCVYNRHRDTFRQCQAFPLGLLNSYGRDEAPRRAFGVSSAYNPLHLPVFSISRRPTCTLAPLTHSFPLHHHQRLWIMTSFELTDSLTLPRSSLGKRKLVRTRMWIIFDSFVGGTARPTQVLSLRLYLQESGGLISFLMRIRSSSQFCSSSGGAKWDCWRRSG